MSSEIFEIIIPSVAFFLAFFLIFTLLELLSIHVFQWLIFRNPHFTINVAIRSKVRSGKIIRLAVVLFIFFFIGLLVWFTDFINTLIYSDVEVKVLGVEMILVMLFIYLKITRPLPVLEVAKQFHKYLYLYTSSIFFILLVSLASQYYEQYQDFINANLTYPIRNNYTIRIQNEERKELLSTFRLQIYGNACPRADFTKDTGIHSSLLNFVYVITHKDLSSINKPINPGNPKNYLTGRLCSHQGTNFLLTDYGQWYWIIEDPVLSSSSKTTKISPL